jgi:hypothetical protein
MPPGSNDDGRIVDSPEPLDPAATRETSLFGTPDPAQGESNATAPPPAYHHSQTLVSSQEWKRLLDARKELSLRALPKDNAGRSGFPPHPIENFSSESPRSSSKNTNVSHRPLEPDEILSPTPRQYKIIDVDLLTQAAKLASEHSSKPQVGARGSYQQGQRPLPKTPTPKSSIDR